LKTSRKIKHRTRSTSFFEPVPLETVGSAFFYFRIPFTQNSPSVQCRMDDDPGSGFKASRRGLEGIVSILMVIGGLEGLPSLLDRLREFLS